jgi:tetratricopeptide (TPR) repeat protein
MDLETICLKCLRKEPGKRYHSAAELAEDIQRFLKGEPIRARPVRLSERAWMWVKRNPLVATLLTALAVVIVAGLAVSGYFLWRQAEQRGAAKARQEQADKEALQALEHARSLLDDGWSRHNLSLLSESLVEANRAADIARSGGSSAEVAEEIATWHDKIEARGHRADKNRNLLSSLLDVLTPRESARYTGDGTGTLTAEAQVSVDEQYATAFQRWGLDVDKTKEADVVARLREEPAVIVQQVITGMDGWMLDRRQHNTADEDWRKLYRIADALDQSNSGPELRRLLVHEIAPSPESVTGLLGGCPAWPALWEVCRAPGLRFALRSLQQADPATEPVLAVVMLARVNHSMGNLAGAINLIRQALASRPSEVVLLNMLGHLLEERQPTQMEQAIGSYRAARAADPNLGVKLADTLGRADQWAEGEAILRDLVRQQPSNPEMQFHLGHALAEQQKLDEAVAAYRKAIAIKPDYPEAHTNLGNTLMHRKRLDEAVAEYHKALESKGSFPEAYKAYAALGNALREQQKLGEAMVACGKAIAIKPDYALAHNNLGCALAEQNKLREAVAAFHKAIDFQPNYVQAYDNLGAALAKENKPVEAEEAFRKAIKIKPDHAMAYYNLGNALVAQKKLDEALAAWHMAIDLKPDLSYAYYNIGLVLRDQKKVEEAVAAWRKAVDLKPDFLDAYNKLGSTYLEQGKFEEAETAARKAIEVRPSFAEAQAILGFALQGKLNFELALAAFRKAVALLPDNDPRRRAWQQWTRQCERYVALDGRLPGVLDGTERLAGALEQLEFGEFCKMKQLYAAAALLLRAAFAADPKLGENVPSGVRYDAACCAILAACGEGKDPDKLTDDERVQWRQQALDWLRADLNWLSKELDNNRKKAAGAVQGLITHWQTNPALTSVRDKDALAKLPEDEHKQWQQLWDNAAALLERAERED